jgi:ABC-type transporter Mla subunit MlaD
MSTPISSAAPSQVQQQVQGKVAAPKKVKRDNDSKNAASLNNVATSLNRVTGKLVNNNKKVNEKITTYKKAIAKIDKAIISLKALIAKLYKLEGEAGKKATSVGELYYAALASLGTFSQVIQQKLQFAISSINTMNSKSEMQVSIDEKNALQGVMVHINKLTADVVSAGKTTDTVSLEFQYFTKEYANTQAQFNPAVSTLHGLVESFSQELQSLENSLTQFVSEIKSFLSVIQYTSNTVRG